MGFTAAVICLLITGAGAWWSAHRNVVASGKVDGTYLILNQLQKIMVAALRTETVAHGYILFGKDENLDSIRTRLADVQTSFSELQQLTQADSDPHPPHQLADLQIRLAQQNSLITDAMEHRRNGHVAEAIEMISGGDRIGQVETIRVAIDTMAKEEENFLRRHINQANRLARIMVIVVVFGGGLSLALVGLSSVLVRRDAAKRKWAEAELDRFFNLSLDFLCILNADGHLTRVNPAVIRTLGWSEEELFARPLLQFVHPDDREIVAGELRERYADHRTSFFECRQQCKDGTWKRIAWRCVAPFDGTLYATAHDVTEQVQTRENLIATLQELDDVKVAFNQHSIVAITDAQGEITFANDKFCTLSQYAREELLGQDHRIINSGHHAKEFICDLWTTIAQGKVWQGEIRNRAKDGSFYWVDTTIVPFLDAGSNPVQYVSIRTDITERKQIEQDLARLNSDLERHVEKRTAEVQPGLATLDATVDGVFIFDPETLRFSYVNEGAMRQVGYSKQELLAMTPLDIKPRFNETETTETEFRALLAPLQRGEANATNFKAIHRHKDGHDIPVEINLQLVSSGVETPRFVALARDITERTRAAAKTAQLQTELERVGRMATLNELSLALTHELSQPLTAILTNAGVARSLLATVPPAVAPLREILDDIVADNQRAAAIIQRTRTLVKKDESPPSEEIDLSRMIAGVLHLVEFEAQLHGVTIERDLTANLPEVRGSEVQLRQVLMNLIVNAIQAMEQVPIGERRLFISVARADERNVLVAVRDSGPGLTEEEGAIFTPFYTTKPDGLGVGLAICRTIVTAHGGRITLRNNVNQGATAEFTLPIGGSNRPFLLS